MIMIQERSRVLMSNYYIRLTCEACKYVIKCVLEGEKWLYAVLLYHKLCALFTLLHQNIFPNLKHNRLTKVRFAVKSNNTEYRY